MNEVAENRCPNDAESSDERRELNDLLNGIIQPIVNREITVVKNEVVTSNYNVQKAVNKGFNKFEEDFGEVLSSLLKEAQFSETISDYPQTKLFRSIIGELKSSIQSSISSSNQALQESIQQNYRKLTYKLYWFWGGTAVFMLGGFILFYILFSK